MICHSSETDNRENPISQKLLWLKGNGKGGVDNTVLYSSEDHLPDTVRKHSFGEKW